MRARLLFWLMAGMLSLLATIVRAACVSF